LFNTVNAKRKLDPANVVKVWKLDEEELASIRLIAGREPHLYNFADSDATTHLSLEEFLRLFEETFPYAQTDILDKWDVSSFNAEVFNYYINREQLTVPGILSARTTAKLIVYCLRIIEAEHEILQASWVRSLRRVGTNAQDLVNSLGARGARVDPARAGSELDYTLQFGAAIRNPVVQAGVNNAAVNRWGLPDEEADKGTSERLSGSI
jgi:hypothetical protein